MQERREEDKTSRQYKKFRGGYIIEEVLYVDL